VTAPGRSRKAITGASIGPSHERWLVSYADFMTLLFAFFVVLFASQRHNNQGLHKVAGSIRDGFTTMSAYAPPASATPVSLSPGQVKSAKTAPSADLDLPLLRKQLQDVLGDSIAKHEIVVDQTPEGLVISLRELGFFDSAQANLLPGAADKIKRTAQILAQHHLNIRVEGHSDDQPIRSALFHSNWELSSARAMTVLQLLIHEGGFDPSKVSMSAYGPYRSLASNATPEGRRQNRRVDLVVVAPTPSHVLQGSQ
jgi:chemotaxis protein MotB